MSLPFAYAAFAVLAGAAVSLGAAPAQAMCSIGSPPIVAKLHSRIDDDPAKALADVNRQLARPGLNRIDKAWLYAAQALAYSTLESNAEEVKAAQTGLKLAPDPRDPPHMELLAQLAFGQMNRAAIAPIKAQIEEARRFVEPKSIADICSRAVIGYLSEEPAEALRQMGTAYRMAAQQGFEAQRAGIAIDLAALMMKAGDIAQAQSLVNEGARWADKQHQKYQSAAIAYRTGMIMVNNKDYAGSIAQFTKAYTLSRRIRNDHFAAFAMLAICQAQTELAHFSDAKRACDNAERLFGDEKIALPRLIAQRSRIALGVGQYEEAVKLSTQVLAAAGNRAVDDGSAYETRARAYAALGQYQKAYADLSAYSDAFRKETEAAKTRETANLRMQVESDRQAHENRLLSRELVFQQERVRYSRNISLMVFCAGVVLMIGVGLFVLNGRRHRKSLEALATIDGLTGLPNRRDASEHGMDVLARAADTWQPVSLALIDVDHFKKINDEGGHAAGDDALRALGFVLRAKVRDTDILGRWGGEEFVIVLPGLKAGEAVDVIERIRAAAASLDQPLLFSAGIAAAAPGERNLDAIVARADTALYQAKANGRNCTVVAAEPEISVDRRRANAAPGGGAVA
ncbi:tetratricopeptide repeat-containing diguanylate cyclase [Novosphingobium sp. Rr 2-17]|uniref:tetratricopeptide repeat-containing diguanylate cyclase n=1 Tax=Novosphingobium sp. Rr 2-17 TaxID=555793 RepID=UPI0012F6B86F|nr:diguanylate cyclase [Novosphingobium sp. Rr 2-17]